DLAIDGGPDQGYGPVEEQEVDAPDMPAGGSHVRGPAVDGQAGGMTKGLQGVIVEGTAGVAPSPGGAGIDSPRGRIGGVGASSGRHRRGNHLVIGPRGMAAAVVSDESLGEGRRIAQSVAGFDFGKADLPSRCEGAVVAARVVAGDGAVTDRR